MREVDHLLPDELVGWVTAAVGSRVVSAAPAGRGITGTAWTVEVAGGERLILRWFDVGTWGESGRDHVRREAAALSLLKGSEVPVAELRAVDVDGVQSGRPALLSTWLPGRVRHDRLSEAALSSWAAAAAAVHRQPVKLGARPPAVSLRGPVHPEIPSWAGSRALWSTALRCWRDGPSAGPGRDGLIHRDLHLGNIVWSGDAVSGLIDWTDASWGPADVDAAHACADLAMLGAVDDVLIWRAAYRSSGGSFAPGEDAAYWVIADIIGFLPDPAHVLPAFADTRPDVTAADVHRGLEDLLGLALDDQL